MLRAFEIRVLIILISTIGEIPDEAIEGPSTALLPLFYAEDQSGIPINTREVGIEALKQLLLEACIRDAKWVGRHPNSLKLQSVPIEEFSQTFDYGLKDITNLDDFNQIVDWENSSFYKQINRYSSPFMIKSHN